ncbi:MAG: serine/threonine-protein kinase, partial [Myxococcota bacterium]
MGAVFEAEHEALGRRVAIKLLVVDGPVDEQRGRRFVREAAAASKVAHPHIVEIFDFDMENGRPYMVMERLYGESLMERMRSKEPMDPDAIGPILLPVIDALAHVHRMGIVHRDVKPHNIFLVHDGTDETATKVKLLDFGIAKIEESKDETLTGSNHTPGTPAYMAPEQISGDAPVGPAADQYAVATVLY